MSRSILRTVAFGFGVTLASGVVATAPAHAGYVEEKNEKYLSLIERSFDGYIKDPKVFDGTAIRPGTELRLAINHADRCVRPLQDYDQYFGQISQAGQATPRGHKLVDRYNALAPWCKKLGKAVEVYQAATQAAEATEKADAAANNTMCWALVEEAGKIGASTAIDYSKLHEVYSGMRGVSSVESIQAYRSSLDELAKLCAQPRFADSGTRCRGFGSGSYRVGNQTTDFRHICVPAADITKSMSDAMDRAYAWALPSARSKPQSPEAVLEEHRDDAGWIKITTPIAYATTFEIPQADKDTRSAEILGWYAAAQLPPPADLSGLWSLEQARLEALKAAVEATAAEWKIAEGPCKGWPCAAAEKQIKQAHAKARIKQVRARPWFIEKRGVIPVARYMSVIVVYQLPGEPYCQARSVTLYEDYKGGGKYQKTGRSNWGFVRFQQCK